MQLYTVRLDIFSAHLEASFTRSLLDGETNRLVYGGPQPLSVWFARLAENPPGTMELAWGFRKTSPVLFFGWSSER